MCIRDRYQRRVHGEEVKEEKETEEKKDTSNSDVKDTNDKLDNTNFLDQKPKETDETKEKPKTETVNKDEVQGGNGDSNPWSLILFIGLLGCLVVSIGGYMGLRYYRQKKVERSRMELTPALLLAS
eukprot:TRINITY_DN4032_c0_g1_i3.p1 TRINITY_DN4032_c0_g1~~TRINITY_DN4032_c0_g1_i3.p1  ORF type:complete len:126 (+),score=43.49 TRINITY_DN4032_c0_g1_i3:65-442(+)